MGLRVGLYAMAAVLLACAAPADDGAAEPRQLPKATGNCLIIRTIDSWRPIDRRHMVVSASRQWIVEFLSPCLGIRRTEDVGFAARDGRLCDFRTDVVIAAGERCRVGSIRPYVEEVDKELEEELEQIEESLSYGSSDAILAAGAPGSQGARRECERTPGTGH